MGEQLTGDATDEDWAVLNMAIEDLEVAERVVKTQLRKRNQQFQRLQNLGASTRSIARRAGVSDRTVMLGIAAMEVDPSLQ